MPDEILDDNNLASNSSDDAALDDAQSQLTDGQDGGAIGADSSDAQGDNVDQPTTLDIVRDVVGKDKEGAASPAEGSEEESESEEEGDGKEQDDEDYSDVPFHKHPRFQHLLRAKKANEADADRHRNVQKFMDQNGIPAEEAANLFVFAALLRSDPPKAWEMAKPIIQELLVACGEVLPPELKAKVEAGEYTAEAAAEIAKAQARAKTVEGGRTFEQLQRDRQAKQALQQSLYDTATSWATDRRKKDPNFAAKEPLLKKEIAWLQSQEGVPDSPEGVKAQLDKAYKAVVVPATTKPGLPAPRVGQVARRAPSASSSASGTARPQPKTTLDIINSVVAQREG